MPKPKRTATLTNPPFAGQPHDSWLLLDSQMCFALYSASLSMTKIYKPALAKLDLTYPQYLVLLVLWEQDRRTVSELGERLFLDSGTLTPLLKRLEALDYVTRRRDSGDERRVIVSLTAPGKNLRKKALAIPQSVLCATGCSLPQLKALTMDLVKLRASLAGSLAAGSTI